MKFMIEEMLSSRVLPDFLLYLMKIGINAELSAPVMSISKIKSGSLKAAKKISSSSFVKKVASVLYLIKPKKREMTIITDNMIAEENISCCF